MRYDPNTDNSPNTSTENARYYGNDKRDGSFHEGPVDGFHPAKVHWTADGEESFDLTLVIPDQGKDKTPAGAGKVTYRANTPAKFKAVMQAFGFDVTKPMNGGVLGQRIKGNWCKVKIEKAVKETATYYNATRIEAGGNPAASPASSFGPNGQNGQASGQNGQAKPATQPAAADSDY